MDAETYKEIRAIQNEQATCNNTERIEELEEEKQYLFRLANLNGDE